MRIIRVVSCFSKRTGELVKDIELSPQQFRKMKRLVVPRADDPQMVYIYYIPGRYKRALEEICDMSTDFRRFEYSLGTFRGD
jgi:hypothetical protein